MNIWWKFQVSAVINKNKYIQDIIQQTNNFNFIKN